MRVIGGRFALEGHLGAGAMGEVYRVRHLHLGKRFALKVIAPAFANDSAARERFFEEAKLASEISHPNIISVVDFGEDTELGAYMVMELLESEPVIIADGSGQTSIKRSIDVLAQVADALEYIHQRGIIHGDIKLENILLVAEPHGTVDNARRRSVRLFDFGLARRFGAHEDLVSGSPGYIAPERVSGGPPTVASDVYALGCLGYVLFTRTLPFDGPLLETLMAHVNDAPVPISQRRGEPVHPSIENMIARAMAKDPRRRHPSAAAFRYELNGVMEHLEMRRRVRSSPGLRSMHRREAMLASLFEHSQFPQALVAVDGTIGLANDAFAKLVGSSDIEGQSLATTPFALSIPELLPALARARGTGTPIEVRATAGGLELCAWVSPSPLGGEELHLILRVRIHRMS
jgi:eukaryotic-like serine/threonine-protein kinase